MAGKTHVFIVGATGYTGGAIAKALLQAGTFRLSILIRESSIDKPVIKELTEAGAEVVRGDISESPEKLESYLKGVDVLISTVPVMADQKPLFLAAKQAGVGRVVPSDFGPIAPKGVMNMHDIVRSHNSSSSSSNSAFIEVGWWLSGMLPPLHSAANTLLTQKYYIGNRDQKLVYSTLSTIGKMVARIVIDPQTLGQTVVVYDGEISINETWKVAEKVTGEDFSDYPKVSDEEIERGCQQTGNWAKKILAEYYRSLFIRGDNTLANAEAFGRLDARKLYDDIPYPNVEEEVRNHYALGFALEYSVPEELLLDVFKTIV